MHPLSRLAIATAVLLALALASCGDDGKSGSRGAPGAPTGAVSGGTAPAPGPVPGSAVGPSAPSTPGRPAAPDPGSVASTPDAPTARVGDWVAWEVRATGSDAVTRVTWRALALDGPTVRFAITSETVDAKGKILAHVEAEETRSSADGPLPTGTPEVVKVAGHDVTAIRTEATDGTVWRSREVPLGGLVRSKASGGVEQILVGYGRGG